MFITLRVGYRMLVYKLPTSNIPERFVIEPSQVMAWVNDSNQGELSGKLVQVTQVDDDIPKTVYAQILS